MATILTTVDKITQFQWSSDSALILAVMATRQKVQVFDLTSPKWECTIDAGLVGVDHAYFSPDGRSVICVAEFNIIMTIFSLVDKSVRTIEWPKGSKECLKFTQDGSLAIVGERKNFKDAVAVIKLSDWSLDNHFVTDTNDYQQIKLNGNGAGIYSLVSLSTKFSFKLLLWSILYPIRKFYFTLSMGKRKPKSTVERKWPFVFLYLLFSVKNVRMVPNESISCHSINDGDFTVQYINMV